MTATRFDCTGAESTPKDSPRVGQPRVFLKPQLQHHQDPRQRSVVSGLLLKSLRHEVVKAPSPQDPPLAHARESVGCKLVQGGVITQPRPGGKSEAVFLFGNGLAREKISKCFLE